MLAGSFRLVTARLIPPGVRPKQAALRLAPLILAACGGSGATKVQHQVVSGPGFRFEAPTGWRVDRGPRQATASDGSELVKVAIFPLQKPYTAVLFPQVERELAVRMRGVAQQTGG